MRTEPRAAGPHAPQAVCAAVVERACEKAEAETHSRRELLAGRTLREVFDKYGVL